MRKMPKWTWFSEIYQHLCLRYCSGFVQDSCVRQVFPIYRFNFFPWFVYKNQPKLKSSIFFIAIGMPYLCTRPVQKSHLRSFKARKTALHKLFSTGIRKQMSQWISYETTSWRLCIISCYSSSLFQNLVVNASLWGKNGCQIFLQKFWFSKIVELYVILECTFQVTLLESNGLDSRTNLKADLRLSILNVQSSGSQSVFHIPPYKPKHSQFLPKKSQKRKLQTFHLIYCEETIEDYKPRTLFYDVSHCS